MRVLEKAATAHQTTRNGQRRRQRRRLEEVVAALETEVSRRWSENAEIVESLKKSGANPSPANVLVPMFSRQSEAIQVLHAKLVEMAFVVEEIAREPTIGGNEEPKGHSQRRRRLEEVVAALQTEVPRKLSDVSKTFESPQLRGGNPVPANVLVPMFSRQSEATQALYAKLVDFGLVVEDIAGDPRVGNCEGPIESSQRRRRVAMVVAALEARVTTKLSEASKIFMPLQQRGANPVPANLLVQIFSKLKEVSEMLRDATIDLAIEVAGIVSEPTASRYEDLLWWGEAMYSHRTRRRFASLEPAAQLFWLPFELAERAPLDGPVGALESYLVERLDHLSRQTEMKLDAKKPLGTWVGETQKTLDKAEIDIHVTSALREVVEQDAYLLPVSALLSGRLGSGGDQATLDEKLTRYTGIPADTVLTAGEWAAQVLRERLIDRVLRGEA